MNGQAIAAQPLAHAGLRALPSEQEGPRPGGVRRDAAGGAARDDRITRATRP